MFGIDLSAILQVLGYSVALIIFAETGLMIGFFLPGDTLLFTAGALAGTTGTDGLPVLDVNIWLMAGLFFVAAVAGNSTGYLIGKHGGRRLFRKKDSRIFKQEYLQSAEAFYEKHGPKAVILAQFIPIIRTFNPIVTGIGKMHYLRFISFNVLGAFLWAFCITIAGFFLGKLIPASAVDLFLFPIIVMILFISLLPAVIHILKDPARREAIIGKIKSIFSRKKPPQQ
ncbi:membrane protein [Alphaproteobacteria bacterium]|nr:membrane protein [Alphaproteobacteria bacterium]